MVAGLQIDLRRVRQTIVHDDSKPIGGTKRRYRARIAIDKKGLDLVLVGHVDVTSEQLAEFAEFDVARCRQYCEQKPVFSLEHDGLGKAIRR
jgi:hypothetical protein